MGLYAMSSSCVTLSDVAVPNIKGYRRKTRPYGQKCSGRAAPYIFGLGNKKKIQPAAMFFIT